MNSNVLVSDKQFPSVKPTTDEAINDSKVVDVEELFMSHASSQCDIDILYKFCETNEQTTLKTTVSKRTFWMINGSSSLLSVEVKHRLNLNTQGNCTFIECSSLKFWETRDHKVVIDQ